LTVQAYFSFIVTCKLNKEPPHGQAHLFFANTKSQRKKIKELALPHRHPN